MQESQSIENRDITLPLTSVRRQRRNQWRKSTGMLHLPQYYCRRLRSPPGRVRAVHITESSVKPNNRKVRRVCSRSSHKRGRVVQRSFGTRGTQSIARMAPSATNLSTVYSTPQYWDLSPKPQRLRSVSNIPTNSLWRMNLIRATFPRTHRSDHLMPL